MKTLIVLILIVLFPTLGFSMEVADYETITLTKAKDAPAPFCPTSKISDNDKCMNCHRMLVDSEGKAKFGLEPVHISENYDLPHGTDIVVSDNGMALYWNNTGTGAARIREISFFLYENPEFKRFIMEMYSGGGSIMDAWRSVGVIQEMQARGIVVETRTYGISASASVILMIAGDMGERYINPHAEVMLHKVWTFSMFDFKTPDSAEDQANTLKHFQTNINKWILSRTSGKFPQKELEAGIFKRDFWLTGEEAVRYGLADKFVK